MPILGPPDTLQGVAVNPVRRENGGGATIEKRFLFHWPLLQNQSRRKTWAVLHPPLRVVPSSGAISRQQKVQFRCSMQPYPPFITYVYLRQPKTFVDLKIFIRRRPGGYLSSILPESTHFYDRNYDKHRKSRWYPSNCAVGFWGLVSEGGIDDHGGVESRPGVPVSRLWLVVRTVTREGGGGRLRAGAGALHPATRAGQGRGQGRGNELWVIIRGNLRPTSYHAIITY